jgi:hypothetical protein
MTVFSSARPPEQVELISPQGRQRVVNVGHVSTVDKIAGHGVNRRRAGGAGFSLGVSHRQAVGSIRSLTLLRHSLPLIVVLTIHGAFNRRVAGIIAGAFPASFNAGLADGMADGTWQVRSTDPT